MHLQSRFDVFYDRYYIFLCGRLEEFPSGKHNIHQRFYQEFNKIVQNFLRFNM